MGRWRREIDGMPGFREGVVCPHHVLVLSGLASWDPARMEEGARRIGRRRNIGPLAGSIGSMFVGARGALRRRFTSVINLWRTWLLMTTG